MNSLSERLFYQKVKSRYREAVRRFEEAQLAQGLLKYVDKQRNVRWGTRDQIMKWREQDFEQEQTAKGLVKQDGKWVSKSELESSEFRNKTTDALADEIADFARGQSVGILINESVLNRLITRFWLEKCRTAINLKLWDRTVASKVRETEGAVVSKYPNLLSKELSEWAQDRNLMRLTRADVKLYLASKNMKLSTSSEQMLYREAKLKYRWLPSWKRE
jgi:predicted house-cleaning noncanonical NTP pyrophosphatase (MazG superfamily)